ncbi:Prolyl oligopeptidase family protein [Chryseobacterium oleae]|uniref:Prolyl oligopeptidase family protein n=1 Tax=Chryseobacterium oleae TaxID=491207 RepID=A0A1I4YVR6_CHROL|nr:prolyl oligopeptidase family serine peptidase [Chryseobacterium oleae]SFN42118.1 Prolyl oligopeptidase family protein [Chryseobacterium oleae]
MDIKRAGKVCFFIFLSVFGIILRGQERLGVSKDTMDQWIAKFYETDNISMSPDGRWISVKKRYTDKDSILIFDTYRERDQPIAVEASMVQWCQGNCAMLSEQGKALWWNLKTRKEITYRDIRMSGLWSPGGYCILTKRDQLQVMDLEGNVVAEISDVLYYITDKKGNLFAQRKTETGTEILKFKESGFRKLVELNDLERMELSGSGKYLVLYRHSPVGLRSLMLMDTGTGTWSYPLEENGIRADFFILREIGNGSAFLIHAVNYVPYPEKEVEVWYGNDRDLERREQGRKMLGKYWIWRPGTDQAVLVHTQENETVSSIGSERYVLVFCADELQDYIHYIPDVNLYLQDTHTGQKTNIGRFSSGFINSEDGSLLVLKTPHGIWQLLNVKTLKRQKIQEKGLKKPYFSKDSKVVYFESETGLWTYSVESGKLLRMSTGQEKPVQIAGAREQSMSAGNNSLQSVIDDKGLVLKVNEKDGDAVSYYRFKNKKGMLLYSSSNNVKSAVFNSDYTKMAVLEENFNVPPRLWVVDTRAQQKKLLFDSGLSDQKAALLRQQIIPYTTSLGTPLKGILYYPANYNPLQEYPVIVHIYQKQSDQAKKYLLPRYDEIGFNIRTLVERGYFVYLPDVVTENGSPGTSGLDAVERSLEALHKYPLKLKRYGLIGHSFGSYLTNFIATHSDYFAAYISGSGVSDLISSYFSYNRNYSSPHYWQLETGQYEIGSSFFENKELYMRNNPILNADRVNAPILLWTGLKDRNVVPEQTMEFYIALKRGGKRVVALQYPDHGHDLGIGTPEAKDLTRRSIDWWDYFLKGKAHSPWIDKEMRESTH